MFRIIIHSLIHVINSPKCKFLRESIEHIDQLSSAGSFFIAGKLQGTSAKNSHY